MQRSSIARLPGMRFSRVSNQAYSCEPIQKKGRTCVRGAAPPYGPWCGIYGPAQRIASDVTALGSLVTTKFKAAWLRRTQHLRPVRGGASPPAALCSTIPAVDIRTSPDPNLARSLLALLMLRHPGVPSPEQRTPVRLVAQCRWARFLPPLWRAHPDLRHRSL